MKLAATPLLLLTLLAPGVSSGQDACEARIHELEEAVLQLGDERDGWRLRAEALEEALRAAEADLDATQGRLAAMTALQSQTTELLDVTLKRAARARFWSRFGCLAGAGVSAWDDAAAGVTLACGVRIFP